MKNSGMWSGGGDRAATLPAHKRAALTAQPPNTQVSIPGWDVKKAKS